MHSVGEYILLGMIALCILGFIVEIFESFDNANLEAQLLKKRELEKQAEREKEREKQLMIEKENVRYMSSIRSSKEYSMVYNKILDDIMAFSKSVKYIEEVNYKINEVDIKRNGVIFYEYKDFEFSNPILVCTCIVEDLERVLPSNIKVFGKYSSTVNVEIHNGDKKVI